VGTGSAGQGKSVQAGEVGAKQLGGGGQHPCGVQRGDQRQEPTGGIGETGDDPRTVVGRLIVHGEDSATRAERDNDVPEADAQAECSGHVVARPRRDDDAAPGRSRNRVGREHARQPDVVAERELDQVGAVLAPVG
jgi:hypothetical protein